jgi:hypothetical protein
MGPGLYARTFRLEPLSHETRIQHDNNDVSRDALPNTAHFSVLLCRGRILKFQPRAKIRIPYAALKAGGLAILGFVGEF